MTTPSDLLVLLADWQDLTVLRPPGATDAEIATAPGRYELTYRLRAPTGHSFHRAELSPAQVDRLSASLVRDISRMHAERLAAALDAVIDQAHRLLPDPYGDQPLDAEHLPMICVYDLDGREAPDATGTCLWSRTFFGPVAAAVDHALRYQLRGPLVPPENTCWCGDCEDGALTGFCALASLLNSPIFATSPTGGNARIGLSVLLPPCREGAPMWTFTDDTALLLAHLLTTR